MAYKLPLIIIIKILKWQPITML